MSTPRLIGVAPIALSFLYAVAITDARADVVPNPTQTCPAGSTADTSHCGLYCHPGSCASDADCSGGKVCREQPLCVRQIPCSNRLPDAGVFYIADAVRECPKGSECGNGEACTGGKRCVTPSLAVPASSGCSLQERPAPSSGALALAGAALLACLRTLRRRRAA